MGDLLFVHFAARGFVRTRPATLSTSSVSSQPRRGRQTRTGRLRCSALQQRPPRPPADVAEAHRVVHCPPDARADAPPAPRSAARCPLLLALATAVGLLARSHPATAGAAAAGALADPTGFLSGLTASFALVLASEIGDKTFFISALLSMKHSRWLVLLGTMLALGAMTVISVGIGQLFHAVPATLQLGIPVDDYAAIGLLTWFGFQNIRDSLAMQAEEADELEGAREVVGEGEGEKSPVRVVSETGSLVFFAEWGDKSMLATVALAAAKSPLGVIVGGVSGHLVASIIAVVGGSFLGKYISEKNARLVGGVLFLVFAVLTFIGIY